MFWFKKQEPCKYFMYIHLVYRTLGKKVAVYEKQNEYPSTSLTTTTTKKETSVFFL
jgi:hypothetical protein